MQWIEQNRGIVPMEFEELLNQLIDDGELKQAIQRLLKDKRKGVENDYLAKINIISDFIEE